MELAIILVLLFIVWTEYNVRSSGWRDRDHTIEYEDNGSQKVLDYTIRPNTAVKHSTFPAWKLYADVLMYMPPNLKADYLGSTEWATLRKHRLAIAGNKCESCGNTINLQLHHITYTRLTRENIEDVRIVCGDTWVAGTKLPGCHQKIHDKYGYDRGTKYPII